nr:hypothetical protein CFP56_75092 [Quercus suber]
MALVRARPSIFSSNSAAHDQDKEAQDPDLARAKDLFELHATMKVAHQDGTDPELNEARDAVARVLRDL